MNISLLTTPAFLHSHFGQSRLVLVGNRENKPNQSLFIKIARQFLMAISTLSLLVALVLMVPEVYYRIFPADIQPVETFTQGTPIGGDFNQGAQVSEVSSEEEKYLPLQNDNLPLGDWLVIPRIGVRTQLQETSKPEEALRKGVWMSPDYGKPGDDYTLPIILAAHRFGWEWWWQSDYWKYNSFYNLPELEPGDVVEVIVDQRKWAYEIYAGEQGTEITDYDADMILYTCKFLNSPLRHFRYARLINPNQDTQG
jgi:sortase (surface protein transpeptidase)